MTRPAFLLLLFAGCTTAQQGPPVRVSAAREGEALRVQFRRGGGASGHRARLEADGGQLADVVHSPDALTVSVLWREPRGTLTCAFPYGGRGRFDAGGAVDHGLVEYVFLERDGISVTATIPRGCVVRSHLPLRIRLAPELLPAQLAAHDIVGRDALVSVALPRNRYGILQAGDLELVLETAQGPPLSILVGIDRDGTPAAISGYVRSW